MMRDVELVKAIFWPGNRTSGR